MKSDTKRFDILPRTATRRGREALEILARTSCGERLAGLRAIFDEADAAVESFARTSSLACPQGCGACCEGFVPDVTVAEAEMVAAQLFAEGRAERARAAIASGDEPPCPLYVADSAYHCSVYEGRPLICRMFGFSGIRSESGEVRFKPCRFMPTAGREPEARNLPAMVDFGSRIVSLDPDGAAKRAGLPELLPMALARIEMLVHFGRGRDDGDNDGGNDGRDGSDRKSA
jgi:Fe-S-cluster containining protein